MKKRRTTAKRTVSSAASPETVFIPRKARDTLLGFFAVSVRLRHFFEHNGFRSLNDLHGREFSDFPKYRNCGVKTIAEIRDFVHAVRASRAIRAAVPIAPGQQSPEPAPNAVLVVPASAREVPLADLPRSVRLDHLLQKLSARHLGDLNGIPISKLRCLKNCGAKTVAELSALIERAAAGEFAPEPSASWKPAALLHTLDSLVAGLPGRNQKILVARFGGDSGLALREVGARFGLTSQGVLIVVNLCLSQIQSQGSRRLSAQLERLERFCRENVCPLTPASLEFWLGAPCAASAEARHRPLDGEARFSLGFYLRLLAKLNPALPVWPSRAAHGSSAAASSKLESALTHALRRSSKRLTLPRALAQVRAQPALSELQPTLFLAALRHSTRFKVEFPQPGAPVVTLANGYGGE